MQQLAKKFPDSFRIMLARGNNLPDGTWVANRSHDVEMVDEEDSEDDVRRLLKHFQEEFPAKLGFKVWAERLTRDQEFGDLDDVIMLDPPAGSQCPHGKFWFAEVASDNPEHPVGSVDIDCSVCADDR